MMHVNSVQESETNLSFNCCVLTPEIILDKKQFSFNLMIIFKGTPAKQVFANH